MEFKINDEALLLCVSNYRPLFDKSDKGYKSRLEKKNCWASVATSLGCTITEAKARFKSLREKYRRERQLVEKPERGGNPELIRPVWPLMELFTSMYNCKQEPSTTTSPHNSEETMFSQGSVPSENQYMNGDLSENHYMNGNLSENRYMNGNLSENRYMNGDLSENQYINSELDVKVDGGYDHMLSQSMNEAASTSTSSSDSEFVSKKRKRVSEGESSLSYKIQEIDNAMAGVTAAIQSLANTAQASVQSVNRYDVFSQYIASELKHLNEHDAGILMEEIQLAIINYKRGLRSDNNRL